MIDDAKKTADKAELESKKRDGNYEVMNRTIPASISL